MIIYIIIQYTFWCIVPAVQKTVQCSSLVETTLYIYVQRNLYCQAILRPSCEMVMMKRTTFIYFMMYTLPEKVCCNTHTYTPPPPTHTHTRPYTYTHPHQPGPIQESKRGSRMRRLNILLNIMYFYSVPLKVSL